MKRLQGARDLGGGVFETDAIDVPLVAGYLHPRIYIPSFLPQADNRHQLGAWIKYYLFLKKDHPLSGKYGVPQKISYLLIPVLILIMFVTGMCLWGVTSNIGVFAALNEAVGGLMVMRIIHYFLMWVFIIFTIIHLYLASIEGLDPLKIMFLRKESGGLTYSSKVHNIVGKDNSIEGGEH